MNSYVVISIGAYAVSFLFMYVWDILQEGTIAKNVVLAIVLGFMLLGAVMAGRCETVERGLTEEEYEELIRMLEGRKRELAKKEMASVFFETQNSDNRNIDDA